MVGMPTDVGLRNHFPDRVEVVGKAPSVIVSSSSKQARVGGAHAEQIWNAPNSRRVLLDSQSGARAKVRGYDESPLTSYNSGLKM
jgi:hypothetical protein